MLGFQIAVKTEELLPLDDRQRGVQRVEIGLGDAQLCQEIVARIEHAFADRRGGWRVSIAGSRACETWEMRVKGPNGFKRSYIWLPGSMNLKQFAD